jgi:ADP-heptose:LPS heptosyltransferase
LYYKIINKKKKIATILFDLIGYIIWAPLNLFQKPNFFPQRANIREILVIRTAYIGDVVMTLPLLKHLKALYPKAGISFLTCSAAKDLFLNNPYIADVLTYDAFWFYPRALKEALKNYWGFLKKLRSKQYDLVIEARADIRDILLLAYPAKARYRISYKVGGGGYLLTHIVPYKKLKHRVEYHLDIARFMGANVDGVEWGIILTAKEKTTAGNLLAGAGIAETDFLVGIHPGGRKKLKSWNMDKFAQLADRLICDYGAKIVFSGSAQERELVDNIINKMKHKALNLVLRY